MYVPQILKFTKATHPLLVDGPKSSFYEQLEFSFQLQFDWLGELPQYCTVSKIPRPFVSKEV